MAVNIFEKYGIKEVANVYFEALEDDIKAGVYKGDIVLFLDTLKVSTIETTAENTAAQGGWGNPKLVQWDYGKEINVTLEDALMSLESLRFMLGGAIKRPGAGKTVIVRHTEEVVCETAGKIKLPEDHLTGKTLYPAAWAGHPIKLINLSDGSRTQLVASSSTQKEYLDPTANVTFHNPSLLDADKAPAVGDHIRIFWEEAVTGAVDETESAVEVTISPDTFPGTYRVVGDTLIRAADDGADEAFQFVIEKAKVQSNVTITLQAEGDPSTFSMTLNVLRATNDQGQNEMMKLVRYGFATETASGAGDDIGTHSLTNAKPAN